MSFRLRWTSEATATFQELQQAAERAARARAEAPKAGGKKTKSSKQEGLFKQVAKAVRLLAENPRHRPGDVGGQGAVRLEVGARPLRTRPNPESQPHADEARMPGRRRGGARAYDHCDAHVGARFFRRVRPRPPPQLVAMVGVYA
jgi:hypothetical protein